MRDSTVARVIWLVAGIMAGVMCGYVFAAVLTYKAQMATIEARGDLIQCRQAIGELNTELTHRSREMQDLLFAQGWMDTRPRGDDPEPWPEASGTP